MQTRLATRVVLFAALATALAGYAQTNVYRWVDKAGKIHFSDTPPTEEARSVTQKRMGGGYVEEGQLPYATQMAMKKNPVTLFTANACAAPCDRARSLLSSRGIPYTERNAQAGPAEAEELRKLAGGLQVPFLLVGEQKLRGYDEDSWHTALDSAGYPRTKLPGQAEARVVAPTPPAPPPPSNATGGSAPDTATK